MGEILLRAENIDKHFGITHALDNVSFTFEKGEIHALIGENGAGKTTLLNILAGIVLDYVGNLTFFDRYNDADREKHPEV